jgi:DNA-binding SARP family transcriptional activator/TolB-like protein
MGLSLALLGGFQARLDTGRVLDMRARKAHALLAYLALPAGRAHPRDALAALLWGEESQTHARHRLRQGLLVLRHVLEPVKEVLRIEADSIWLDPSGVEVDVAIFERLVEEGTPDALRQAGERYQGNLLEGIAVQAPAFEEWLLGERERLRELAIESLAKLLAHQRLTGAHEPAIQSAVHLLALDPLQEAVHRVLMLLFAEVGRRGAALRQYQLCRDIMQRELGAEPEEETRQLYESLSRERSESSTIRVSGALGDSVVSPGSPGDSKHGPSIAALPFREYGEADEQGYFGAGFIEDIVGALATFPDLFVVSRNSTARFQPGALDTRKVALELGVRYLLTGSIRRSDRKLRIVAELSDAETGTVLWDYSTTGSADDLFSLQDQLSERIITTIAPYIRNAEIRRAFQKRPESLGAYDLMLRGLHLLYRLTPEPFAQAREMFRRSIELDPGYAAPHALSALWHSIRLGQGWSENRADDQASVARLAAAAIERDPFDARALALAGHVRGFILHDYDGAFALFERAIAASPNSALAWARSSPTFSFIGEPDEARRRAVLAVRLSPFDPHLFFTLSALGLACYTAGQFNEAVAWGRRSAAENPNFTANLRTLVASLAAAGDVTEAQRTAQALLAVSPAFRVGPFCEGYAYRDPMRREALAQHLRLAGLPG